MTQLITVFLMVFGTAFALLSAVAIVRMPDLYTRMHGATKCSTLGVASLLLAVAVHVGDVGTTTRSVLVIGFLFLTAPIAAHVIGRAAYKAGTPLWKGTLNEMPRDVKALSPSDNSPRNGSS